MNTSPLSIISVGGSLVIPSSGVNHVFLKKFKRLVEAEVANGKRFILVIGGGATARMYQAEAKKLHITHNDQLDLIGIQATRINAQLVHSLFGSLVYKDIVADPRVKVPAGKKPIIIAAGWKPGASTDYQAVLLAKTYGAKQLINLSNIDWVYDKDPNKYADAQKIEHIDWNTFRKEIVGNTWTPGKNVPFDPIASRMASTLKLDVHIINGQQLSEVQKALRGKPYKGTNIHP